MTLLRRIVIVVGAALIAVGLPACGSQHEHAAGSTTTTVVSSADHNNADIDFAQGMVPHHEGALRMAELVPTRSTSTEVKALAARIHSAQQPEIDTMQQWLVGWGLPKADRGMGMDMGSHGPSTPMGMMTEHAMTELRGSAGTAFDRRFLDGMIEHHRGAVEMSKTELAKGKSAAVKDLAQRIIDAQQREIAEMQGLRAKLG